MKRLLILGASGLVGGEALRRALADPRVSNVIAPTRRPLPRESKLVNPVALELDSLMPAAGEWPVDSVICALGTTMRKAGSQQAFRHADYDLPLAFARLAHQRGAQTFALTSSKGASASSRFFYTRVKGELERDIGRIGFQSLLIARPGMIGGHRSEIRPGERLFLSLFRILAPVLPQGLRISRASRIAEVLVEAALSPRPGVHIAQSASFA